jgi:hypothetical protein
LPSQTVSRACAEERQNLLGGMPSVRSVSAEARLACEKLWRANGAQPQAGRLASCVRRNELGALVWLRTGVIARVGSPIVPVGRRARCFGRPSDHARARRRSWRRRPAPPRAPQPGTLLVAGRRRDKAARLAFALCCPLACCPRCVHAAAACLRWRRWCFQRGAASSAGGLADEACGAQVGQRVLARCGTEAGRNRAGAQREWPAAAGVYTACVAAPVRRAHRPRACGRAGEAAAAAAAAAAALARRGRRTVARVNCVHGEGWCAAMPRTHAGATAALPDGHGVSGLLCVVARPP